MRRIQNSIGTIRLLVALTVAALYSCAPSVAISQWQRVATNLFNPNGTGALIYSHGLVWLACDGLWMSPDSGVTWTRRTFPDPAGLGLCYDLDFFDNMTGLAACPNGAFLTKDQGVTWTKIRAGSPYGVAFGKSASIIGMTEEKPNGISISGDGGLTWTRNVLADYTFMIRAARDGSLVTYCGNPGTGGNLYTTTDLGVTWQKRAGKADFDSFSFAIDSCDDNLVYLVNEDVGRTSDNLSQIFRTKDLGGLWSIVDQHQIPFYAGSIATGYLAIYAQTIGSNVFRSTDRGDTWKNVGGPQVDYDTRLIAAINDNIVLAADIFGNIWRTVNGGGDSISANKFALSTSNVVFPDTVGACDSASTVVAIAAANCGAPTLLGAKVVGGDSLNFLIEPDHIIDSLVLLFSGDTGRTYSSQLILTLSDSTTQRVPLTGYGRSPVAISFTTQDASNDTIGGSITIPLISSIPLPAGDVTYRITFDTTQLQYVGSYSSERPGYDLTVSHFGNQAIIDRTLSSTLATDQTAAYTLFRIFPHHDSCTNVVIDSVRLSRNAAICGFATSPLVARVCSPIGCGTPLISDELRYHAIPSLELTPNPSQGFAELTSTREIKQAHIILRDVLGRSIAQFDQALGPDRPLELDLRTLPSGSYIVSVSSEGLSSVAFSASVRLLLSK